jgi:hypothetical protein
VYPYAVVTFEEVRSALVAGSASHIAWQVGVMCIAPYAVTLVDEVLHGGVPSELSCALCLRIAECSPFLDVCNSRGTRRTETSFPKSYRKLALYDYREALQ